MDLKNKRILITAGPTWVAIDNVRVISNIATGRTGILLAEKLQRLGAKVNLLLGQVESCCLSNKIKLMRFTFFDELYSIIKKELRTKKYDILIHSAAVSDYRPAKIYQHKIKSGINKWRLKLIPTEKIINLIKKIHPDIFLVGFKFDLDTDKEDMIKKARILMTKANLDLAVANTINKKNRYRAHIVNHKKIYGPLFNRQSTVNKLTKIIGESYGETKFKRQR